MFFISAGRPTLVFVTFFISDSGRVSGHQEDLSCFHGFVLLKISFVAFLGTDTLVTPVLAFFVFVRRFSGFFSSLYTFILSMSLDSGQV